MVNDKAPRSASFHLPNRPTLCLRSRKSKTLIDSGHSKLVARLSGRTRCKLCIQEGPPIGGAVRIATSLILQQLSYIILARPYHYRDIKRIISWRRRRRTSTIALSKNAFVFRLKNWGSACEPAEICPQIYLLESPHFEHWWMALFFSHFIEAIYMAYLFKIVLESYGAMYVAMAWRHRAKAAVGKFQESGRVDLKHRVRNRCIEPYPHRRKLLLGFKARAHVAHRRLSSATWQLWHWMARPLLDVVLPRFTQSTCADSKKICQSDLH